VLALLAAMRFTSNCAIVAMGGANRRASKFAKQRNFWIPPGIPSYASRFANGVNLTTLQNASS